MKTLSYLFSTLFLMGVISFSEPAHAGGSAHMTHTKTKKKVRLICTGSGCYATYFDTNTNGQSRKYLGPSGNGEFLIHMERLKKQGYR